ncbi:bifunctional serine/threonine-protein kinase/ABC transporter substrate-binding protein [Streptomyces sp. NPDC056061]|uniref:bifunctional serine/threonine-protein kinase/ABC transporter substrate-binding protein n=1 Tax=Streptomyces sp. NPDC056061 TaxID=3345700 RepID=UPI0035E2598C
MQPLTPGDPRTVGVHCALARLGAGGMGVVYLARSSGGELAAVKVIRAEHAADPGFRTRFRREAEAARRVTGPWVVPVTDADTEAREPWIATAYVPGPSLAEVVAEGPLPPATVRALGARLADALVAVHEAGLVHRDVKPANVLLALDGPRLIDFGIARHEGATALTEPDALIGTPGYLAPEQASGDRAGPACDVFALGCVLAYTATGRRPFGDGGAAAVLFRTVHEPPDLRGLPSELLTLVEACLAKDPADRPTAWQVARRLAEAPGEDPRAWAPAGLSALIATRSAAALDLPAPEPPTAVAEPGPARPTRRTVLTAGAAGAAAVLLAGGAAVAWTATRRRGTGTEHRTLPTRTIGLHADLTGPGRAVGLAHQRGMRLAVENHNARAGTDPDARFRLALRTEDDAGDAAKALRTADRLAADPKVLAVVGPTGTVVAEAVVGRYEKAGLAQVVVAARSVAAEQAVAKTLCVIRPPDSMLPAGLVAHIARSSPAERVMVVEDGAAPEAAWAIAQTFRDAPPEGSEVTVRPVAAGTDDFGPAARAAVAAGADAVVYAGSSPTRGARLAVALASAGFTGTRMSTGPVLAPAFRQDAGEAAEGWVFAEAYTDPSALPGAKAFTAAHRKRFGTAPARWAAEAYDAVGLIARAAGTTSAAGGERGGVVQRLFRTSHPGITRTVSFHPSRQVKYETGIFLYRVEKGRARFFGPYPKG